MFRTKSNTTCRDAGRRARTQRTPRGRTMQRNATEAERERAKADHLIEKFRTIGPAAVAAALVRSDKPVKKAATVAPEASQPETD